MPRSFDVSVESSTSVEQFHAALSGQDYWLARLAASGESSTFDSLIVDPDRTVRMVVVQDVVRDLLPGMLAKFYRRDLTVRHTETWRSIGGQQLRGEISVVVSGGPGSGSGVALITPTQTGSRLTVRGTVEFKVPLVGGVIESFLAHEFAQGIPELQRFTTTWIGQHS
ncbi:DUF2505 domain-containing protein [Mycobacterium sp.]|uniref:DUF2505 domain-containing protein n=1 Tax=Mycobacterium sp. TaxID=1785 RepID=UPI00126B00D3|nr:DUF2505 domain-containing protein [Mycobacterium sp.]KAA8969145.1 MAG: DUF2505 domain-containing protein [Mycobacterium sp.]